MRNDKRRAEEVSESSLRRSTRVKLEPSIESPNGNMRKETPRAAPFRPVGRTERCQEESSRPISRSERRKTPLSPKKEKADAQSTQAQDVDFTPVLKFLHQAFEEQKEEISARQKAQEEAVDVRMKELRDELMAHVRAVKDTIDFEMKNMKDIVAGHQVTTLENRRANQKRDAALVGSLKNMLLETVEGLARKSEDQQDELMLNIENALATHQSVMTVRLQDEAKVLKERIMEARGTLADMYLILEVFYSAFNRAANRG